jgi:hypothetical protein
MEKLNRGDKIYLDLENKNESLVNEYLECRDGIVEVYEYRDQSGYGSKTRLFLCKNTKHESISIIRQIWLEYKKEWFEEYMVFDSDSFAFMKALINNKQDEFSGTYTLVRDY